MDYNDFANVPGGYTGTDTGKGYATPKTIPAKKTEVSEDFDYQSTIFDGVGDYHFNHFIAYFEPVQQNNIPGIDLFFEKFCDVFSKTNIADVTKSDKFFKGVPAYQFILGGTIGSNMQKVTGAFHQDWVAMQMLNDGKSFYGTTLKRRRNTPGEDAMLEQLSTKAAITQASEDYQAYAAALLFNDINKKHFLAGRRSWRVGYDSTLKHYYAETAALERSSDPVYALMEKSPMNLRQDIIDLWTNLIANFTAVFGVTLAPITLPQNSYLVPKVYDSNLKKMVPYGIQYDVAYQTGSTESIVAATDTLWFKPVLYRHLGLIKDL